MKKTKIKKMIASSGLGEVRRKISFDWFFDKRVLIPFCIICSLVLWFMVASNVSADETKVISSVPITIDSESVKEKLGLEIIEIVGPEALKDRHMDVEISGRRYALSQISAEDITITAQVSGVSSRGVYPLALSITCNSGLNDVTVTSNNNQYLTARFDLVKKKVFTIEQVNPIGATVTSSNNVFMDAPFCSLSSITVSGPESEIETIAVVAAVAEVDKELSKTEVFDGRLVFYDESGNVINTSRMSAEEYPETEIDNIPVNITVPIKKSKKLTPVVSFKGKRVGESFDFSKLRYTANPSSITVKGAPAEIESAFKSNSLTVGEVDLSQLNLKNKTFTFAPNLMTGVEILGEAEDISVTFSLSGYKEKRMSAVMGVSGFTSTDTDGRTVTFETTSLAVDIVGPAAEIGKLTPADLTVVADLTGMDVSGKCSVPVNIYVTGSKRCWVYGSYKADVLIYDTSSTASGD